MIILNKFKTKIQMQDGLDWQTIKSYLKATEGSDRTSRSGASVSTATHGRTVVFASPEDLDNAMRAIYELKDEELRESMGWG